MGIRNGGHKRSCLCSKDKLIWLPGVGKWLSLTNQSSSPTSHRYSFRNGYASLGCFVAKREHICLCPEMQSSWASYSHTLCKTRNLNSLPQTKVGGSKTGRWGNRMWSYEDPGGSREYTNTSCCVFHWSTVFWNITSLWQRKIKCLYPRISNYHSPGSPGVNNRQTILLFRLPQPEVTCWQGETDLNRIKDRKNVNVSPLLSSSHLFCFLHGD